MCIRFLNHMSLSSKRSEFDSHPDSQEGGLRRMKADNLHTWVDERWRRHQTRRTLGDFAPQRSTLVRRDRVSFTYRHNATMSSSLLRRHVKHCMNLVKQLNHL
jgi:hypothetical protein